MPSHRTYVLCEKGSAPPPPPPPPNGVYHDFNQPISNVDSRHVKLLEKEIANNELPPDLKSKVINMKIQDLLMLNKDLKYGKRQRAEPPARKTQKLPSRKRKRINETGAYTGEDYVTSKLKQYATPTQLAKAQEIIKHFQDNPEYAVNLETGALTIKGQRQQDSAIDIALALTSAPSKKRPQLKNFAGVTEKLSETDFPLFLITHKPTREKYTKLYGGLINW